MFIILGTAVSLPVVFAIWVLVEGLVIAVQSFDYKSVGFRYWWVVLILGICGAILGVLGLKNLDVTALTLSTIIGCAIIANGLAYFCALLGIKRFEEFIED